MGARENILKRIRASRGVGPEPTQSERTAVEAHIREHPVGTRPDLDWPLKDRFREQCVRMSSTIDEVATLADVPRAVAEYLRENGLPARAVAWAELAALDWSTSGVVVEDRPATGDDLVGITSVHLAIAETGTLMVLSGPSTPAATSLLPETHIAVVPMDRMVVAMEEAWALTRGTHPDLPRAVNFISGPSRTADIEGQLQLGAHGPFRVHVIVVG
ncbi:MAG: lactate utilization protein C [Betaproteobacteria bacterium]|nr:lactate utilization protein C [Betaproteobacteria bacterium]